MTESKKEYPSGASGFLVKHEIGSGAFAVVFLAEVKGRNEEVAIKIVDLDQFSTNLDEIRKEILTMSMLNHANIVKIYTSFVDEQSLWIVMPLLAAGSCSSIMKSLCPSGFKDEELIATILREALKGLEYLHHDGKIHRDIKAGNILVGAKGEVELADFGVAGTLLEGGDRRQRQTFTGTPCWMAPEVMEQSNGYDVKADIWSIGITAMELGYGSAPYSKYPPMKVLLLTLQEPPPTCAIYNDSSTSFSKAYHNFIASCLQKDPTKRPTAKQLLSDPFIKKAGNSTVLVDKIVKRVLLYQQQQAAKKQSSSDAKVSNLIASSNNQQPNPRQIVKAKPVTIGSWVFDRAQLEEYKKLDAAEKRQSSQPSSSSSVTSSSSISQSSSGTISLSSSMSSVSCASSTSTAVSTNTRFVVETIAPTSPVSSSIARSPSPSSINNNTNHSTKTLPATNSVSSLSVSITTSSSSGTSSEAVVGRFKVRTSLNSPTTLSGATQTKKS
eukprot:TRINITY_DN1544_c0_g1_i1.p1 TRINITY_DN1544_c0_g1~~TRINITY_DN1544_c0_g1_i1.p1  ORF type:complete len:527 (-),score=100.24 TRINITY_DN1544_c0_g1_i1:135-1628(-)